MTEETIENLELLMDLAEDYGAKFTFDFIGNKGIYLVKFKASMLNATKKETDTDLEKATERLLERVKDAMV